MLRLFLHRHGLYEMSYWSLFDDIQGVAQMSPQAIDYRELGWPEDTEFIYTPFQVIAITSETTYSKLNFSQEGYLFEIETYKDLSLIHISEPTRPLYISYAVFCLHLSLIHI